MTNLQLLQSGIVVVLLVALATFLQPIDDERKLATFLMMVVVIGGLSAAVSVVLHRRITNKNSIWFEPVSTRVSAILINSVVSIWLCVVGLIVFMVLTLKGGSLPVVVTVVLSLLLAVAFGRYFQKRFSRNSLLSYGVSFFIALIIIVLSFAVG